MAKSKNKKTKQPKLKLEDTSQSLNTAKLDKKAKKARAKEIKRTMIKEAKIKQKEAQAIHRLEMRTMRENWYKLDNAALIYPAIDRTGWNSVFRLTATMNNPIDTNILQQALDDCMQRYPFYNVSLRDGLFWHYFQNLTTKPTIELEKDYPCRPFVFDKDKQIFRVLYYNSTISFETFHSLADGGGAIQFFNTLLVRYCILSGVAVDNLAKYNLNALDLPDPEESEDAFNRYADGGKPSPRGEPKAYAITGAMESVDILYSYTGRVDVAELKALAKSYNATINEFLSAVYMQVMIQEKHRTSPKDKRPVKLSVPVNLRRMFPSKTMRNFSQFINLCIPVEKENAPLQEIVDIVREQSAVLTKDYVMGIINANVSSEKNFFVRIMPLFIKDFVLNIIYSRVGENLFTSTISNLGIISLPPELKDYVVSYNALLGSTKLNKINLTVSSYNNTTALTFTTRLKDNRLVRAFFGVLTSLGLTVTMHTNKGV